MARFSVVRTGIWLASLAVGLGLVACGGGGSGDPAGVASPDSNVDSVAPRGLWKGALTAATGESAELFGFVAADGESIWMTPDGRVYDGTVAQRDTSEVHLRLHEYDQDRSADTVTMMLQTHSRTHLEGRIADQTFSVDLDPLWGRPAALDEVAGVYTRSLSSGYTMTMSITAAGELTASDSWGCQLNGAVEVPDPEHNLYRIDAEFSACGSRDGHYQGFGALMDASGMRDWIDSMQAFEHGGPHRHGGPGHGGTVIVDGEHNLFMFGLFNDESVAVDALGR